jgi:hypothetical protein
MALPKNYLRPGGFLAETPIRMRHPTHIEHRNDMEGMLNIKLNVIDECSVFCLRPNDKNSHELDILYFPPVKRSQRIYGNQHIHDPFMQEYMQEHLNQPDWEVSSSIAIPVFTFSISHVEFERYAYYKRIYPEVDAPIFELIKEKTVHKLVHNLDPCESTLYIGEMKTDAPMNLVYWHIACVAVMRE